jgi:histidine triad (HIT) family protein
VGEGAGVTDCLFCAIVAGDLPAEIVRTWRHAIAFVPLNPVVTGHLLVIPKEHAADAGESSAISAITMQAASALVSELPACNIITSKGREATQSVFHLHLHVIPRSANDGLALPWYSGKGGGSRG